MAEEKTIIIKNEEEKKSNFTFKNYIASLKLYKYWILGVSLLVAIIGYLVTSLGINKELSTVSSTYSYSFETESYYANEATLFDGSTINVTSIVTADNIEKVYNNTLDEEGNKVFEKLNLEDIIEESNLSLILVEPENQHSYTRKLSDPVSVDTFTITANLKPFKIVDNAKLFIRELVNSIPNQVKEIFNSYRLTSGFTDYNENDDFYQTVSSIVNEYETIYSKYSTLVSKYSGDEFIEFDNRTLTESWNSFYYNFSDTSHINYSTKARSILTNEGYINNFDGTNTQEITAMLQNRKQELVKYKKEMEEKEALLKKVIDSYQNVNINSSTESDANTISFTLFEQYVGDYKDALSKLDSIKEMEDLISKQEGKLASPTEEYINGCKNFKKQLNSYIAILKDESSKVSKISSELAMKHSSSTALFSTAKIVEVNGTIPPVLIAGVGLVLGFVASSLVCTYIYINKYVVKELEEKEKKVKAPTTQK